MGAIDGEQVIVKEVKATRDAPLWRLFREVYIQAAVSIADAEGNHKHVTKLKGWSIKDGGSGQLTEYTAEDCFYIVLEYAGTELHTFVDDGCTMQADEAYKSMSQIVMGLTHLHKLKFYHRDLKLENVAKIDDPMDPLTGRLRLIDFGSSTQVHMGVTMSAAKKKRLEEEKAAQEKTRIDKERATQVSKSQKAHTRAPEIVTGAMVAGTEAASEKLDVWGLGIILFGLIFGKPPYGDQPATDEDFNQESDTYKTCWDTTKYDNPSVGSAPESVRAYYKEQTEAGLTGFTDMKELLDNMLQSDPAKRWSLEQVRRHLKILAAKPLSVWLQEERDHADKTGKMINVKSLFEVRQRRPLCPMHAIVRLPSVPFAPAQAGVVSRCCLVRSATVTQECGESLLAACDGVDVDIQIFIATLPVPLAYPLPPTDCRSIRWSQRTVAWRHFVVF